MNLLELKEKIDKILENKENEKCQIAVGCDGCYDIAHSASFEDIGWSWIEGHVLIIDANNRREYTSG